MLNLTAPPELDWKAHENSLEAFHEIVDNDHNYTPMAQWLKEAHQRSGGLRVPHKVHRCRKIYGELDKYPFRSKAQLSHLLNIYHNYAASGSCFVLPVSSQSVSAFWVGSFC
jgi:hypothetical protein